MGLTLALNAAEGTLHIALGEGPRPLCGQSWDAPTRSTEILAPALEDLWKRLGVGAHDIQRIACVAGPGSFTGLRLVLATAAALRRCTGATLAGLDYMQLLALSAADAALAVGNTLHDAVWVVTHARRNLVHCQAFSFDESGGIPQPLGPVALLSPEQAAADIGEAALVVGSGLVRQREVFAAHCPSACLLPDAAATPTIDALWRLALAATYADADVEPLYVRPCDAVDNLPRMAERLGLAPDAAQATLEQLLHRTPEPLE